jgi:selenocysteine lyase/cysteine desulfurase
MTTYESLISREFPQLNTFHYFDYYHRAPIPTVISNRIRSFGDKLFPSPHSSEEQSDFDRTLTLLRKNLTDIFGVSLINYEVVLFGTTQSAVDELFEGFQWSRGSHYVIDKSFKINTTSSILFATKAGGILGTKESSSSAHSLFCVSYSRENIEKAINFQMRCSGSHHILIDATQAAPYEFADLTRNSFDFVILSMMKICGIELCPTLMKLESAELLSPFFYGGGAVSFSCARTSVHRHFRSHSKRFENGTLPQLSIFCALDGLILMRELRKSFSVLEKAKELIEKLVKGIEGKYEIEVNEVEKMVIVKVENAQFVQQELLKEKIIVGIEKEGLIISIGFPTKESDIEVLIEFLVNFHE